MSDVTWFCFARVLPKLGYKQVSETEDRYTCYKDDEPLLELQKVHRYHPLAVEWILRRVQLSADDFMDLLRRCNAIPTP